MLSWPRSLRERAMITFSAESNEFDPSLPRRANVTLPAWVNEPLPSYSDLLSAHDVARLTRRPRLLVLGMVLIGRFPRKHSFHGRRIGWLRSEVLDWLSRDVAFEHSSAELKPVTRHCTKLSSRQPRLPYESAAPCGRPQEACSGHRRGISQRPTRDRRVRSQ
jgi:predicted DNA-binding transcriptional regulator AlpA